MQQNIKDLYGLKLVATDGEIGHVKDFYFNDKDWAILYLVVDTGTWLTGRLVLLSPHAFGPLDLGERVLHVSLRKGRIERSPSIESHKPVSRQYEMDYYRYYGWHGYWNGGGLWGFGGYPVALPPSKNEIQAQMQAHQRRDDVHLRSTKEINGYRIHATDGAVGFLSGLRVDDKSWAICELVAETGHWYSGKEILIPPAKVTQVNYGESTIVIKLTMADIQATAENAVAKVVA